MLEPETVIALQNVHGHFMANAAAAWDVADQPDMVEPGRTRWQTRANVWTTAAEMLRTAIRELEDTP